MTNTCITDLLPHNTKIHGTVFEDFVNNTIGYLLELVETETQKMKDGCFINTAEGKYLDLWGKDYNIPRLPDESDDDYRKRLMILPLDQFSIATLYDVYNIQLLTYTYNLEYEDGMLLSDNHLLTNKYWVNVSDTVWDELNKKFIVKEVLKRLE